MAFIDPVIAQKVEALKKRLRTVTIDRKVYFIAEGDMLLEEDALPAYVPRTADITPPNLPTGPGGHGLVGILEDGKFVRWPPGFEITYCVLKATFEDDEYATVRANVLQATSDWEDTCGVQFRYVSELDGAGDGEAGPPAGAVFAVRKVDASGEFIAVSFFPNDPPGKRLLNIDLSYFAPDLGFDAVGVLRHELGHVIGFRHEHILSQAPAACHKESLDGTIDLTKYDPKSVMHYFCGGVGTRELAITDVDRAGSQKVYGPPLAGFRFVR